jgi:8-oxo-dGTP diphosphatase
VAWARVDEVDWERWVPRERATLLFVIRDGRILLIHKKRGFGAGKINGPGGKIDGDETHRQCAIREVQEELCVTPLGVRACGELSFQFVDGHSIHGAVFRADDCDGEPRETDEARPFWSRLDAIPFERMWEDDVLWFPLMLAGTYFRGRFLFDGDTLLGWRLDPEPARLDPEPPRS